jgi:S1-C subfamily serine protease
MDTAASSSFAFSAQGNQGFAIPIAYALGIAKSVEAGRGTSAVHVGGTAFIGVVFFGSGSAQAPSGSNAAVSELEVGEVVGGAPAEQAGITAGDTITGFAGTALTSPEQLTHLLVGHHPGDKVALSWTDSSGQSHTATVTLASGPPA